MYLYILVNVLARLVNGESDNRIVGGNNVSITEHPYQAVLYADYPKILYCGAVILSSKYLLTAAHCAMLKRETYSVVIGADFLPRFYNADLIRNRTYELKDMCIHPKWNDMKINVDNDIAILTIDGDLNLHEKSAKAIKLPQKHILPGTVAVVSGFGLTERQFSFPQNIKNESIHLKAAAVPIVDHDFCVESYSKLDPRYHVTENMVCAGGERGNDSCGGDSGGPLVSNNKIIGIVSFGEGCGGDFPGVYTDVYKYLDFIHDKTNHTLEDADDFDQKQYYSAEDYY